MFTLLTFPHFPEFANMANWKNINVICRPITEKRRVRLKGENKPEKRTEGGGGGWGELTGIVTRVILKVMCLFWWEFRSHGPGFLGLCIGARPSHMVNPIIAVSELYISKFPFAVFVYLRMCVCVFGVLMEMGLVPT